MLLALALAHAEDSGDRCACEVDAIDAQAICGTGKTIELAAPGCEGGTFTWTDDLGFEGEGEVVDYTCPAIECPGEGTASITLNFQGPCNGDFWLYHDIAVKCPDESCGCATPATPASAAWLGALGALALVRRRAR